MPGCQVPPISLYKRCRSSCSRLGYNLRNFFECHHKKKNVLREGKPEVSGFNDGCHRRLTIVRSGCENTSFAQVAPSESILSISVAILARLYYHLSTSLFHHSHLLVSVSSLCPLRGTV